MPQSSLRSGSEAGKPVTNRPVPAVRNAQTTDPKMLILVALVGLLIVYLGIGWSQGWFSHADYAPRPAVTPAAGSSDFSEDHPMGNAIGVLSFREENIVLAARFRDEMKTEPRHTAGYICDRKASRRLVTAVRIIRAGRPFVARRSGRRRVTAMVVVGIGPRRRPVLCVCRKGYESRQKAAGKCKDASARGTGA